MNLGGNAGEQIRNFGENFRNRVIIMDKLVTSITTKKFVFYVLKVEDLTSLKILMGFF